MNRDTQDRQQTIIDWFDATYRREGKRYLRPVRAYYVFLELLQARPGQRLLDVACGLGRLLEAAREYDLQMSGIDISAVAIAAARDNVPGANIRLGNAEHLPYDDAAFDFVTCIGSLERMLHPEIALAEMHRVGTPTARYCLMLRNSRSIGWRIRSALSGASNPGHASARTPAKWSDLLESCGFSIRTVVPDQYPLHRRQRWSSLFLKSVNFRTVIPGPVETANECVYLLEKKA